MDVDNTYMKSVVEDIGSIGRGLFAATGILLSEYRDGKLFPVTESKIALDLLFDSGNFPDLAKIHKPYQHLVWLNCFWLVLSRDSRIWVAGPTLAGEVATEVVARHYFEKGYDIQSAGKLAAAYRNIPVLPYATMMRFHSFLTAVFSDETAAFEEFLPLNDTGNPHIVAASEEEIERLQIRDFTFIRKAREYFKDCIQTGDTERIRQMRPDVTFEYLTQLAPTQIRSLKNNLIISIADATRIAI